ncbi:hypothetical protein [Devosia ginsengisoli]|uniref:hypothetical protein n=1 Tax=Devosia ginsengisoli TaxID=400770 RepID=UPI001FE5CB9D|nr:hypothetical protein [Devosia ginsengisoli]
MKRRGVLGLLSAGAATALLPAPAIGQMNERRIGIDAHTHIFNVLDLPWASFLWRVQARQFEETLQQEELRHDKTLVVQGLLAVLTSVVVRAIEPLKDIEPAPPGTPLSERFSRGATEERFLGSLAETLRLLFRDTATFERLYFPPFGEELAAHGRAVADMDVDRAAAAEAIREEINAQLDQAIKEHEEAWYQWAQTLANSSGWLGRGLDFGRRLASPKAENLDTLFGLYTNREGPALVAAALVDLSGWLDEEPTHSIAYQIEQMGDLQWCTRTGTLMQMIVPFNPWRQVVADIGRASGPDPIALITEAVEQRGAVGVKIYPPMGFLPIGNAEGDLAFPARAKAELGSGFQGAAGRCFAETLRDLQQARYSHPGPYCRWQRGRRGIRRARPSGRLAPCVR